MNIHDDIDIQPAVTIEFDDHIRTFSGREAWAFQHLHRAGDIGVTALERPAPRWSHYIMMLRRAGLDIETIMERHGGPYSGSHGRYVLRSRVTVLGYPEAQEVA